MTARRWKFAPINEGLIAKFSTHFGVPLFIAQCLLNRGCATIEEASAFLSPRLANLRDPFELPDMDQAVDRLFRAHAAQERFVIFGDYDVDGVTATALLTEIFQRLGWHSLYYLPHRVDEGYGLTREAVLNCLRKFPVKLLLAVDCGSTATEQIHELRGLGVEVIVLDHHQFNESNPAIALVNPQRLPEKHPSKPLCSAGLAFKLAHAVLKRARVEGWQEANKIDLKQWLDLVALGTIADMAPLLGENRIFARSGLEKLAATSRPGLAALKKVCGINREVTATHVGFQLGPRLNAAGRLETALDALELLLATDPERSSILAELLNKQNQERQETERATAEAVLEVLRSRFNPSTHYAIIEGEASWHIGVVGIVASRVLREFHRPTIILGGDATGAWRGSGRSIEGFDLAAGLRQCSDLLLKHGGHAMAAGVTIKPENISEFRLRFNQLVQNSISPESLLPAVDLDAEIKFSDLHFDSLKQLESLQPFGQGNAPVQFAARKLQLRSEPRRFGSVQKHLRFTATDGVASHQVVWWNAPESAEIPGLFDLAFSPELNEFNGTIGVQLRLVDMKSSAR